MTCKHPQPRRPAAFVPPDDDDGEPSRLEYERRGVALDGVPLVLVHDPKPALKDTAAAAMLRACEAETVPTQAEVVKRQRQRKGVTRISEKSVVRVEDGREFP